MPSIRPIITVPHETLRKKSADVALDKKTLEIAKQLEETLFAKTNPQGVGLSAPQIDRPKRIFVTWLAKDGDRDSQATSEDLMIYINPMIVDIANETTYGPDSDHPILEGCLSIPKIYGPVPRAPWVMLKFITLHKGNFIEKEKKFEGFLARIIQHEFDHLEGKLFTDYSLELDLPIYEFIGKKAIEINKELLQSF